MSLECCAMCSAMRIGYCSLILLVKDFPCLQSSDKAAGAQVYFVSINNVDGEPDFVINLVAPGVPCPTVPPVSMASIQVPELCFQPYGLHQFSLLKWYEKAVAI